MNSSQLKRFKEIPNFPRYYINRKGKIWSAPKGSGSALYGKFLKLILIFKYFKVGLHKNCKKHIYFVHRLVLETFVGPCPPKMQCRHLNGNPTDNRLKNLCWGTSKENGQDMILHGNSNFGEKCSSSKLTKQNVKLIRKLYKSKKFNQPQLADKFNVSQSQISYIIRRKEWRHI